MKFRFYLLLLVLLLTGCRVDLYNELPEGDANQMLAILMLHNIEADKEERAGGVTLRVEKSQFINAVDILRLNGFPRRVYVTAQTMFPPNQLVVSPAEEQQKIIFLKEQRIENMLSLMDGVVDTNVTIASSARNDEKSGETSVAVFIKYSPRVNFEEFRTQIKNLLNKSIPGMDYSKISILMQPAEYRMHVNRGSERRSEIFPAWLSQHRVIWIAVISMVLAIAVAWREIAKWIKYKK